MNPETDTGVGSRIRIAERKDLSAEQIILISEILALEERIIQRRLWSAASVRRLLQGAADAAVLGGDLTDARALFEKAEKAVQEDVQTKNRMFYLLGTSLGVAVMAGLTGIVLVSASYMASKNLAEPDTIISLFTFAGMG